MLTDKQGTVYGKMWCYLAFITLSYTLDITIYIFTCSHININIKLCKKPFAFYTLKQFDCSCLTDYKVYLDPWAQYVCECCFFKCAFFLNTYDDQWGRKLGVEGKLLDGGPVNPTCNIIEKIKILNSFTVENNQKTFVELHTH